MNAVQFVLHNSYLLLLDIKLLYISIPNAEGVKAVKKSLDNYPKQTVATKVVTTFLDLILSLNSFIFNSVNYPQTKGCAMRTICAPSYVQH